MSVDGYIAALDGGMDWMIGDWDDKLKEYITGITDPVDCIILGRKLAEGFIPYWTGALNNPEGEEEGARKMVETPKIVFSKTLKKSDPLVAGWENTELAAGDLVEEITKLKNQPGKDIIVYGGAAFVSSLIKHGLIDEFHLLINPTAIGKGMPIFKESEHQQSFRLIKAIPFECGIVVLYYEPKSADPLV